MSNELTYRPGSLGSLLNEFEAHMKENSAKSAATVENYMRTARRFVDFVGNEPLKRIDEDLVKDFFTTVEGSQKNKRIAAMIINHFMRFALVRLPVAPGNRAVPAPDPIRDAREIALRERWTIDRVLREKEAADDLIAALGRQFINHFLFFRSRLAGEPTNLDELIRICDECKELIERNLPLFLKLSALNKNLGPIINERILR